MKHFSFHSVVYWAIELRFMDGHFIKISAQISYDFFIALFFFLFSHTFINESTMHSMVEFYSHSPPWCGGKEFMSFVDWPHFKDKFRGKKISFKFFFSPSNVAIEMIKERAAQFKTIHKMLPFFVITLSALS